MKNDCLVELGPNGAGKTTAISFLQGPQMRRAATGT